MKNVFTLLITLFLTFSHAQQVTIGSQGMGVFFSSEENVYVTAIVLKFENAVTLVRGSAFESYWVPLLIDENDFSLSWNQNVGDGDNANRMLLNGNSVKAAFKPTSNEFKQFYNFSVANELIEIVEVTGYVSEDGSVPASSDLVKLTTNLDNTLNVNDVVFSQVQPYPNPFNDIISIPGLKESVVATVYDLAGREVFRSDVSPVDNTLNVSALSNSLYLLNIDNGASSKAFTILKR